jgi:hypothetical protein
MEAKEEGATATKRNPRKRRRDNKLRARFPQRILEFEGDELEKINTMSS